MAGRVGDPWLSWLLLSKDCSQLESHPPLRSCPLPGSDPYRVAKYKSWPLASRWDNSEGLCLLSGSPWYQLSPLLCLHLSPTVPSPVLLPSFPQGSTDSVLCSTPLRHKFLSQTLTSRRPSPRCSPSFFSFVIKNEPYGGSLVLVKH